MSKKIEIDKIRQIVKNKVPGVIGRYRYFSVLMPLTVIDGETHMIFEVRAFDMKRQPGEICFPGGRMEAGESPCQCAVRETVEELGLAESDIEVLAQLDSIVNYSGFTIYCFLGFIEYEKIKTVKLSKGEVDQMFTVPLRYFLENSSVNREIVVKPEIKEDFPFELLQLTPDYHWRKGVFDIHIYKYEDKIIWGLTGRMIHRFAEEIKSKIDTDAQ